MLLPNCSFKKGKDPTRTGIACDKWVYVPILYDELTTETTLTALDDRCTPINFYFNLTHCTNRQQHIEKNNASSGKKEMIKPLSRW